MINFERIDTFTPTSFDVYHAEYNKFPFYIISDFVSACFFEPWPVSSDIRYGTGQWDDNVVGQPRPSVEGLEL